MPVGRLERSASAGTTIPVCLHTMFETYLATGPFRSPNRHNPQNRSDPTRRTPQLPMYRTYLAPAGVEMASTRPPAEDLHTTDVPDILGPEAARPPEVPDGLYITMYRTYLRRRLALSGRSTLAIVETYEVCVHHDRPSIFGACTHDEPDILLPMNRTYLGRALTMNRTYHYR
jgi:hypothetical protein